MKRSNNQISQITTEEEKQEIFNIKNIIKQQKKNILSCHMMRKIMK